MEQRNSITLELIEPSYCLIRHLPDDLPEHLVTSHQMTLSLHHDGYVIKLNMLNSLKRFMAELGVNFPCLPNLAFKMHRPPSRQIMTQKLDTLIDLWKLEEGQVRGIRFYLQHGGRVIIGDDWAMGKTLTSLAIIEATQQKNVLIIAPQILITHWEYHIRKRIIKFDFSSSLDFAGNSHSILQVINTANELRNFKRDRQITSPQVINDLNKKSRLQLIPYEVILSIDTSLEQIFQNCQCVVCDQAQIALNSQFLKKFVKIPPRLILLSDCADKWLIDFIPLINTRVDEEQVKNRYKKQQAARQFQSIITKYYYVKTSRRFSKPPVLVKPVLLPHSFSILNSKTEASTDILQIQTSSLIEQKYFNYVEQYLKLLILHKNVKQVLLIYINDQILTLIKRVAFHQNYNLVTQNSELISEKNVNLITLKFPELNKIIASSCLKTKDSRIIFLQLPSSTLANEKSMSNYTHKLFLLSQKIQFFLPVQQLVENKKNQKKYIFPVLDLQGTLSGSNECKEQQSISKPQYFQINSQTSNQAICTRVVYFDAEQPSNCIGIQQPSEHLSYSHSKSLPQKAVKTNTKQGSCFMLSEVFKNQPESLKPKQSSILQVVKKIKQNDQDQMEAQAKSSQISLYQFCQRLVQKLRIRIIQGVSHFERSCS